MSYHDTIRTAIGSLVAGRYYPVRFPQETSSPTWPAIRGTIVSLDNAIDQCGAGELDGEDVRMQIDVCAVTYGECIGLAAQASVLLAAVSPPWIRQPGGFEEWDSEAKVWRVSRDWALYQSAL